MSIYLDASYLFNHFINKTAKNQSVKYHVGNFPGGKKSIVVNKYNLIIDSTLSILSMFDDIINKINKQFNDLPIKLILSNNYKLTIPREYKGETWNTKRKKYVMLDFFIYLLGCDIKECLEAYDKANNILGNKLFNIFDKPYDIKAIHLTQSIIDDIKEFKQINDNWESLIKETPSMIGIELTDKLLNKHERKQLRLIYYNYDIIKNIYNEFIKIKPDINKHFCKDKFTLPGRINQYTKDIKYKLSYIQSRLTPQEIDNVFDYVISHVNLSLVNEIENNSIIISDNTFINTPNETQYYIIDDNDIIRSKKQPNNITTLTKYTIKNKSMLDMLNDVDTTIPIIDIDPNRHLEIFVEYPQNILFGDNFTKSFISDFDWKSLNRGLNNDIFTEYQQNINIVINRYKFKYSTLT